QTIYKSGLFDSLRSNIFHQIITKQNGHQQHKLEQFKQQQQQCRQPFYVADVGLVGATCTSRCVPVRAKV
uniref:Ovule protein n=1 Tax=Globodera pallida TaxID=36090 RepID=A0A183CU59_GLOPA